MLFPLSCLFISFFGLGCLLFQHHLQRRFMICYCIDLSRIYLQEEKYTCKHLWITFLYADVIH